MKALVGFQPGEGPSRGLLRDCTTGCGTDGALHSSTQDPGAQEAEGGDQQTGGAGEAEIGGRQSTSGVIFL